MSSATSSSCTTRGKRRRTIANRILRCGLTDYWTLESFPWQIQKSLARHRKEIEELAELDFLDRGESVVFVGKAGVGKSGASGILLKALYAGRMARAVTAQDLFDEFDASVADRSAKRLIKRLSAVDLLLIEEFGYVQARSTPQTAQAARARSSRPTLASRNGTVSWATSRLRRHCSAACFRNATCSPSTASTYAIPPTSCPQERPSRP